MIYFETKAVHFGPPHGSDVREEPRRRGLAFLLGGICTSICVTCVAYWCIEMRA